jgi:PAS domain S-box-containing protein
VIDSALDRQPVLSVLDQLPLPVLAVQNRGTILFANQAIADLLGYQQASMSDMTLWQILEGLPPNPCVHHYLHAHAGRTVGLIHAQGSIINARMSASALRRYDDPGILSAFVPIKVENTSPRIRIVVPRHGGLPVTSNIA